MLIFYGCSVMSNYVDNMFCVFIVLKLWLIFRYIVLFWLFNVIFNILGINSSLVLMLEIFELLKFLFIIICLIWFIFLILRIIKS